MKLSNLLLFLMLGILNSCIVEKEYLEPERVFPETYSIQFRNNNLKNTTYYTGNNRYFTFGHTSSTSNSAPIQVLDHTGEGEQKKLFEIGFSSKQNFGDLAIDKSNAIYIASRDESYYYSVGEIVKYNKNGEFVDYQFFSQQDLYYQQAVAVDVNDDNEILVVLRGVENWSDTLYFLTRLSSDFEEISTVRIDPNFYNISIVDLFATADGGCVFIGKSPSNNSGYNIHFIKLDVDGNEVKETVLEGSLFHNFYQVEMDENENFILLGNYLPQGGSYSIENYRLAKFDQNFNLEWSYLHNLGQNVAGRGFTTDENGNYYVVANMDLPYSDNYYSTNEVPVVFKINTEGELVWTYEYPRRNSSISGYSISIDENSILNIFYTKSGYIENYKLSSDGTLVD